MRENDVLFLELAHAVEFATQAVRLMNDFVRNELQPEPLAS